MRKDCPHCGIEMEMIECKCADPCTVSYECPQCGHTEEVD